ncbi:MAG TPA: hypothetical protein VHT73_19520 [Thermodesulfobacteriota bacterium]|nr:hypothetical protein [Thermodesulfobacteriota bacterium]
MITLDRERCAIIVRVPYNRHFVEALKATIPQRARCYDLELKLWYV